MVRNTLVMQSSSCTKGQASRFSMKNLIVNADDLGWTAGVNRGIAEAHKNGIVTSTSLLANGSAFRDGVQIAQELSALGVGVHLNLSDGPPTEKPENVSSLLNEKNELHGGTEQLLLRMARGKLLPEEVEKEWDAQICKIREAGIEPTHLDGHKHVHMLPRLFPIALRLAKRHGISAVRLSAESSPLRTALSSGNPQDSGKVFKQGFQARGLKILARTARELAERAGIQITDFFCGIAQTGELTRDGVLRLLENLPEGSTELMCHPGYLDEDLRKSRTRLLESRATELAVLTDTEVRNCVASQGIRLINYEQLIT